MTQEFQSTKYFSVGDLFLDPDGKPYCYIVKITQWKKGAQYTYHLEYFDNDRWHPHKEFNTIRLKDKVDYFQWKHIPVVK